MMILQDLSVHAAFVSRLVTQDTVGSGGVRQVGVKLRQRRLRPTRCGRMKKTKKQKQAVGPLRAEFHRVKKIICGGEAYFPVLECEDCELCHDGRWRVFRAASSPAKRVYMKLGQTTTASDLDRDCPRGNNNCWMTVFSVSKTQWHCVQVMYSLIRDSEL